MKCGLLLYWVVASSAAHRRQSPDPDGELSTAPAQQRRLQPLVRYSGAKLADGPGSAGVGTGGAGVASSNDTGIDVALAQRHRRSRGKRDRSSHASKRARTPQTGSRSGGGGTRGRHQPQRPAFLAIGVQKSGTSTLAALMAEHPQVRACVRTCVRACVRACARARVRACMRACVRACVGGNESQEPALHSVRMRD